MKNKKIDWNNLGFNAYETKSMYRANYTPENKWQIEGLVPYGDICLSPASTVLNYGQGIFEGTKAYQTSKERVVCFRLKDNAKRFRASSERMCIAPLPEGLFEKAVQEVVKDNLEFLPKKDQGSLYVRPIAYGEGPMLGVKASDYFTFLIYVTPVGSYFNSGLKRLNTIITDKYHRVATKSVGSAKAVGNYAGTLLPYKEITDQGYDEIIFLNSSNENIIDEARKSFDERLDKINWDGYYQDLPFNPSALSLYKWAPIADELKTLDRKIVLNSMILKWDVVKQEFKDLIQF